MLGNLPVKLIVMEKTTKVFPLVTKEGKFVPSPSVPKSNMRRIEATSLDDGGTARPFELSTSFAMKSLKERRQMSRYCHCRKKQTRNDGLQYKFGDEVLTNAKIGRLDKFGQRWFVGTNILTSTERLCHSLMRLTNIRKRNRSVVKRQTRRESNHCLI